MKKLIPVLITLVLVSCEKRELPVPAYERGDVLTTQVEMGGDYKNQVWYSLHDNRIVSVNVKTDWDLAFEASPAGFHVFLNGSKAMKIFKTNYSSLNDVKDTLGLALGGRADMPSGNVDSTATGDWKTDNKVYVIHRGYTPAGQLIGYYKLKVISTDATRYVFEYANIKTGEIKQGIVYKDEAYDFIQFSFNTNSQLNIEPKKTEYDLCFTQYTHLFYEPELQYYQVTGVLTNMYKTRVARITNKSFDQITMNDTTEYPFSERRDKIGYDWKYFDLNTNLYTVNSKICYLIRDHKGFYYKFHFIDFLNSSGIKGYPKFEVKKL